MTFGTIADIRKLNASSGHHFFDKAALVFFDSIIESGVINGRLFVTSERNENYPRQFTVRYAESDGTIVSIGVFQQFATLLEAVKAAETVESCANCGALVFEDEMRLVHVEPMSHNYPGYPGDLYCVDCGIS